MLLGERRGDDRACAACRRRCRRPTDRRRGASAPVAAASLGRASRPGPCRSSSRSAQTLGDRRPFARRQMRAVDDLRLDRSPACRPARCRAIAESCACAPSDAAGGFEPARDAARARAIASPSAVLEREVARHGMIVASARPSALSGRWRPRAAPARRMSSSICCCSVSSSTRKRAATLASNGNCCSSRVQKPWMVCTLRPPGVSSAEANSRRARSRCLAPPGFAPVDADRRRRAPRRRAPIHCASVSNTRFAMLAAAALVKVRQRIFAGSVPLSSSRITRCASTWVLPAPALADTQAETAGSDAACWPSMTPRGWRGRSFAALLVVGGAGGQRPFLDARQMVVVAGVAAHEHRPLQRAVGRVALVEPA